ncbi:MAG: SxtJ family membrane protein [Chitinophagales bacterium]|nr:SxtJ family membrane protein [Chitinophagales bacterium]
MQLKLPKEPYKDILTMSAGFLILHLLVRRNLLLKDILFYLGIGIPVVSLLSSFVANKIVWAWYKLAQGLGYVNSRIILSLIFFVFLTPLAFLSRLKKGDSLHLKKSEGSYFITRNHPYAKKDLEKMW